MTMRKDRSCSYKLHPDFKPLRPVSREGLQKILDMPVVNISMLPNPIIIVSVTLYHKNNNWFVGVRGMHGEEGIAPCSDRVELFFPLLKKFASELIGRDARKIEEVLDRIYVTDINYKIQGLAYWCPIAWLESALLDMLGHAAGLHVSDLLGGKCREEIALYLASGNRQNSPEEEIEILDKHVREIGAEAVKFKLGGRMSRNRDARAGRTEGLLQLARKHFGDDFIIHADGNGSYDAQKGIEVGKLVEDVNGYFYEEPCPFDDLWALKDVADNLEVPLAFGEQETSLRRFAWNAEHHAARVLQPDLQYTGGFIPCIKVARMAQAAGMTVTPHVSGGYTSYNALIYNCIIPNAGHYHEYKGFADLGEFVEGGLTVKEGKVKMPEGIGLGIDFSLFGLSYRDIVFEVRA